MNEPNDASSGQAGQLAKSNQMDKLSIAVVWPITLCICLINFGYVQGSFLRFTNITCESKDLSTSSIEYCYVGHLDRLRNYMSVRYKLVQPLQKDFFVDDQESQQLAAVSICHRYRLVSFLENTL
ncbi:uncharacterized protein Tsp42Ep isoform X2 [Drosophila virilis]|uniref:uncharacterized protein Tsp42Ep isoform X2 n=1 Tax=Drosophila virilis TaxID=7244 RepID=UPI0038B4065C